MTIINPCPECHMNNTHHVKCSQYVIKIKACCMICGLKLQVPYRIGLPYACSNDHAIILNKNMREGVM